MRSPLANTTVNIPRSSTKKLSFLFCDKNRIIDNTLKLRNGFTCDKVSPLYSASPIVHRTSGLMRRIIWRDSRQIYKHADWLLCRFVWTRLLFSKRVARYWRLLHLMTCINGAARDMQRGYLATSAIRRILYIRIGGVQLVMIVFTCSTMTALKIYNS